MASRSTRSVTPTSPSRVRLLGLLAGPLAAAALLLIPSGLHEVPGAGHRPAAAARGMALGAALEQWHQHRRIALLIMRTLGTEQIALPVDVCKTVYATIAATAARRRAARS